MSAMNSPSDCDPRDFDPPTINESPDHDDSPPSFPQTSNPINLVVSPLFPITFAGGSISRRVAEIVAEDPDILVHNKSLSGAGILSQNSAGTRKSIPFSLNEFENTEFLCLQLGGNDFFSHKKIKQHFTNIEILKSDKNQKAFLKLLDSFFWSFTGKIVFIIGMIPRYLNVKCCYHHELTDNQLDSIFKLVKMINIGISKKCNFHTKRGKGKFVYLDPKVIIESLGVSWEAALHKDNIHLDKDINRLIGKEITRIIKCEVNLSKLKLKV